jgi:hypothetical protein
MWSPLFDEGPSTMTEHDYLSTILEVLLLHIHFEKEVVTRP